MKKYIETWNLKLVGEHVAAYWMEGNVNGVVDKVGSNALYNRIYRELIKMDKNGFSQKLQRYWRQLMNNCWDFVFVNTRILHYFSWFFCENLLLWGKQINNTHTSSLFVSPNTCMLSHLIFPFQKVVTWHTLAEFLFFRNFRLS